MKSSALASGLGGAISGIAPPPPTPAPGLGNIAPSPSVSPNEAARAIAGAGIPNPDLAEDSTASPFKKPRASVDLNGREFLPAISGAGGDVPSTADASMDAGQAGGDVNAEDGST